MEVSIACSTPECKREAVMVACKYHETMIIDIARSDAAIYVLKELLDNKNGKNWRDNAMDKIVRLNKEKEGWD